MVKVGCSRLQYSIVRCSTLQAGDSMADLSFIPEAAWCEIQNRAGVVRLFAERGRWPRHVAQAAAAALGITCQTLYRHVDPNGLLRWDREKLLSRMRTRPATVPSR